jgi:mono/diheme cytochrome c family protein
VSRRIRLVVIPAVLFVSFGGLAFGLAKAHLASPSAPKSGGNVALGDPYRGETVFQQNCAACHGAGGAGGGIGPRLVGDKIPLAAAKAQIDNGGGAMPPSLVKGADETDVLAYLATILGKP